MNLFNRFSSLLALTALLGAGCLSGPDAAPGAGTSSGSGSVAGCSNEYYPLTSGRSITYSTTPVGGRETTITFKFLESATADIKIEQSFSSERGPLTITTEADCVNGAIVSKGYADFGSAISGLNIRTETESVDGVFMPARLAVGTEWTTTYRMILHTDDARFRAMMDGKRQTATVTSKVIGEESITVPAGTFRALKVEQQTTVNSEMLGGQEISVPGTLWLVKDTGMVKSQTNAAGSPWSMEATEITR